MQNDSPYKEMAETMETRSRGPGRPRLPTPQRRQNILDSKAKWRSENREYYLQQKRQLACRPDYLARRRELNREKSRAKEDASYLRSLQSQVLSQTLSLENRDVPIETSKGLLHGSILDFSTL